MHPSPQHHHSRQDADRHVGIEARLARIRLLLLDVDGVLTDGSVTLSSAGEELKTFHVRDGLGLRVWQQSGGMVGIITGRSSRALTRRAEELGVGIVRQGIADKLAAAADIIEGCGVTWEETAFVGDDLPDLPVVARCGVGMAVADACLELKAAAGLVTELAGGRGAVREAIERMLRARGGWESAVAGYAGGIA